MPTSPREPLPELFPLQFRAEQRPPARLKSCPEDFRVSERHWSQPHPREGQLAVIEVTKRNLTTPSLLRGLADLLGLARGQLATAGFKDRLAITQQRLTLPRTALPPGRPELEGLLQWEVVGFQDLPLRPGQLRANHFEIVVEGQELGPWLESSWKRQQPVGFANYFGIQRFGPQDQNWQDGLQQLRHPPPRKLCRRWPHNYPLSSVQARLFNRFLDSRIRQGRFQQLQKGEWCQPWPQGDAFVATGEKQERHRLGRFELTPLGPIWGYKLLQPGPDEIQLLAELGLTSESFRPFRAPGSRRPTRLPLPGLNCQAHPRGLRLEFELPPGAYATVLLQHFFDLEGSQSEDGNSPP